MAIKNACAAFAAFITIFPSIALADGYQDFSKGVDAGVHHNPNVAVTYLSNALTEADLPAHLRATAYLARANAYAELGEPKLALADYALAKATSPDRPDVLATICQFDMDEEMYVEAIADCSTAIDTQPSNWRLYQMRIVSEDKLQHYGEAMADYATFIALRPNDIGIRLDRADLSAVTGKYDDAVADANAAAALMPAAARPYATLGLVAEQRNDFDTAVKDFDTAIARYPNYPAIYGVKGRILLEQGKYQEASEAFKLGLDQVSLDIFCFLGLSISSAHLGVAVPDDVVARFSNSTGSGVANSLIALYVGKVQPAAVLAMNGNFSSDFYSEQCEANLYVGEWYLIQKDAADGKRTLVKAQDVCVGVFRHMAEIELSRLN